MISNPANQGHGQQQLDRAWLVVLDAEIELPATQPRELSSTWQLTGSSLAAHWQLKICPRGGGPSPEGANGDPEQPLGDELCAWLARSVRGTGSFQFVGAYPERGAEKATATGTVVRLVPL